MDIDYSYFADEPHGWPAQLLSSEALRRDRLFWVLHLRRIDAEGAPELTYALPLEERDGTPVRVGSDAEQLALAFAAATGTFARRGCTMLPGDEDTAKYVNGFFVVRDVPTDDDYLFCPLEYVGQEYTHVGEMQPLEAVRPLAVREDAEAGTGGEPPAEPEVIEWPLS